MPAELAHPLPAHPLPAHPLPAWLAPAVVAPLAVLQLVAFHWGVVTPDTVWQYSQALAGAYDNWHPPVVAALWRLLGAARFGGAPLLLFDCTLYWGGVLALAEAARRDGGRRSVGAILLLAALPIPFGQMGALLKDAMLAAACLAGAGMLALHEARGGRGRLPAIAGALFLLLASATRINAVFATAPLLAMLLPAPMRMRWRWPLAVAAAGVLAFATAWTVNTALLRPHDSRPILSLVNFDFGGIVAHGGANPYPQLTPAEATRLTALCYRATLYTDSPVCNMVQDGLALRIDRDGTRPAGLWLHAIAHDPLPWLRHRLAHLNENWRFIVPAVPADAVYIMSEPNDLGLHFTPNSLTKQIVAAAGWLAWSPLGRPATWVALAAGLLLAGVGRTAPLAGALAWSALLYAGGYAVVSVAPDLRYNLWTLLAAGSAAAIGWRGLAARRRRLAVLPAFAAILIEIGGLAGILTATA